MTTRRTLIGLLGGVALAGVMATGAVAQEVTLKLHQFLPAQANVPKLVLDVWADRIEEASDGRIEIQRFPSMQLGGTPPQLIDQAIDGVADIVWGVNGFTPGRFPRTEVFELPFFTTDAASASSAYWQMFETHMADTDFQDLKILGTWVHGPGMLHTNRPVATPADMSGLKVRGASRMVTQLLDELGATSVGMPVTSIPESLSKGVIDGAAIPWEVTTALKVAELVDNHTEFAGPALYNVTFVLAMNKDSYESLPDDLKAIIDANSGHDFSVFAGTTQASADGPARQLAAERGNNIITISAEETARWAEIAQPVYDKWVADMDSQGIDGQALIDEARSLMEAYASN
ncbi:TRAP transporter substrate-binding protein [Aestuariivita sp.]|jgi:TRAP-type C4-dicarboxylate transport system substrate-binding protein|uniref:TRAP transporter substrate-binding protein n=1 Tax=Aestuariivita sp. TaxID=1872407 RepID=UPI0021720652|nr:TRAP transporter substrate-binding protein [Aestuariivita sp.]MCE8005432.1 TRAP transporter substrate-binding protein [Aestuariivita sp.]